MQRLLPVLIVLLEICSGWMRVAVVRHQCGPRARAQLPVLCQRQQHEVEMPELSELADILNPSDLAQVQSRLRRLAALFPGIEPAELHQLVQISPLLLFVDSLQLEAALARLRREMSYIDPSYLLQQRAPGLELLLSLGAPAFNLTSSLRDVVRVAGPGCNVTQLVRRAPQVLTPRYLLAMSDVVWALGHRVRVCVRVLPRLSVFCLSIALLSLPLPLPLLRLSLSMSLPLIPPTPIPPTPDPPSPARHQPR